MAAGRPILFLIYENGYMAQKPIGIQDLIPISDNIYEIAKSFRADMRVPARVFASKELLTDILKDNALEQLINVCTLPGIVAHALAMPDIHQGYGFPIGGVAAIDPEIGVISPGGIGYDINCGMRFMTTPLHVSEIKKDIPTLAHTLFKKIPSGVGTAGALQYTGKDLDEILTHGAPHIQKNGFGSQEDILMCEEHGCLKHANPDYVSKEAKKRGSDQIGTLGSGNHFLELQCVETIFEPEIAKIFGLFQDQLVIMIHCGSRGLGHQVCTDYVHTMVPKIAAWGITIPDRELACAPFRSTEGQQYFMAMACAANFAWANRHVIGHLVRQSVHELFGKSVPVHTLYDVSHNIGKLEWHAINTKEKLVLVHRKGATRAFGPGHPDLVPCYQKTGQPVLIPGTMGTASYVLAGTTRAMEVSLGSSCHGAGRKLSRSAALKTISGPQLRKKLESQGITICCPSNKGLAEEAPIAYKNVDNVVNVVSNAGIAQKVVRLTPIAVIKG